MVNSLLVRVAGKYIPFSSIRSVTYNKDRKMLDFGIWDSVLNVGGNIYEEIPPGYQPSEALAERAAELNKTVREK